MERDQHLSVRYGPVQSSSYSIYINSIISKVTSVIKKTKTFIKGPFYDGGDPVETLLLRASMQAGKVSVLYFQQSVLRSTRKESVFESKEPEKIIHTKNKLCHESFDFAFP